MPTSIFSLYSRILWLAGAFLIVSGATFFSAPASVSAYESAISPEGYYTFTSANSPDPSLYPGSLVVYNISTTTYTDFATDNASACQQNSYTSLPVVRNYEGSATTTSNASPCWDYPKTYVVNFFQGSGGSYAYIGSTNQFTRYYPSNWSNWGSSPLPPTYATSTVYNPFDNASPRVYDMYPAPNSVSTSTLVSFGFKVFNNTSPDYPQYNQVCADFYASTATTTFSTPFQDVQCYTLNASGVNGVADTISLPYGVVNYAVYFYNSTTTSRGYAKSYNIFVGGQSFPQTLSPSLITASSSSIVSCDSLDFSLVRWLCIGTAFVIIPSQDSVNDFQQLPSQLSQYKPFSYFFQVYDTLESVTSGSSATTSNVSLVLDFNSPQAVTGVGLSSSSTAPISQFGTIRAITFFSTSTVTALMGSTGLSMLRTLASYALWLAFVWYLYSAVLKLMEGRQQVT